MYEEFLKVIFEHSTKDEDENQSNNYHNDDKQSDNYNNYDNIKRI